MGQFIYFNMDCMLRVFLLHLLAASFTIYCNREDVATSLEKLVDVVTKESSPTVVYDASYEYSPQVLRMVDFSYPLRVYEYKPFYSFIKHHMKSVLENGTLTELYKQLNFILICGKNGIENLVKEVTDLDMTVGQGSLMRHFSTWLIISHDSPPHLNVTLDNVALLRVSQVRPQIETYLPIKLMENPQRYSEYLKASCSLQLTDVYSLLWMPGRREWSRVQESDAPHDELFKSLFTNTKRGLNGRTLRLSTLEVPFRITPLDSVMLTGTRKLQGCTVNNKDFMLIKHRYENCHIHKWTIMTIRTNSSRGATYMGAGIDTVDMLARMFNFSYVIAEPEDMLWGNILENGRCTGVLGMLQRVEADLCPAPYAINQRRTKVIDISSPLEGTEWKLLYKRQKVDTDSWGYLLPWFSWRVYLCGFASLLWMMLLLSGITNQDRTKKNSSRKRKFSSCLDIGIHIPLRQAILRFPESTSERIIIWTWCTFCLVVTAVYAGNLVAFASVNKYNPPFTTLQELAEQDEYAVGVSEGDYAESILMNSGNPTLKLINQRVLKTKTDSKSLVADNKQRLLNTKYVLISPAHLSTIIRSSTCDVVEMKETFATVYSGFAFPQNSPLKKLFDKQVSILREFGVFTELLKKWSPKPLDCDSSVQVPQVKLTSMKTVFVVCSAGIFVAVVVLLVEIRKQKQYL